MSTTASTLDEGPMAPPMTPAQPINDDGKRSAGALVVRSSDGVVVGREASRSRSSRAGGDAVIDGWTPDAGMARSPSGAHDDLPRAAAESSWGPRARSPSIRLPGRRLLPPPAAHGLGAVLHRERRRG